VFRSPYPVTILQIMSKLHQAVTQMLAFSMQTAAGVNLYIIGGYYFETGNK